MKMFVALAFAAMALSRPAQAEELWRHEQSGISIPRTIGDMSLGSERDLSGGASADVMLQYGNDDTVVTLYVYRSAYPNPALWFERTRLAMQDTVSANSVTVAPRAFTLGAGSVPNGLREEIDVPANALGMRASGVAIAQSGAWMVKVRISSRSLDRAGISQRMDAVLAAFQVPRTERAPHPLTLPGPCTDTAGLNGAAVPNSDEVSGSALANGLLVVAEGAGGGGLAAEPSQWCRMEVQFPVEYGTVYRARDGSGWVALIADSGRAVVGRRFLAQRGRAGAGSFVVTPTGTTAVAGYRDVPNPDEAIMAAVPVLFGESRGLGTISSRAPR